MLQQRRCGAILQTAQIMGNNAQLLTWKRPIAAGLPPPSLASCGRKALIRAERPWVGTMGGTKRLILGWCAAKWAAKWAQGEVDRIFAVSA